ncbi:Malolactic regulator [Lacticaseibacillus rhamnosus]|nr:Malolactic regulator [Lacticaseibacillus rhamnosus]KHJ56959.1 Malolactic regulator [Lacticaseibacillus rhamnosus]OAU39472.1 Malolactic regulator [Lacticaseibacillus rhamnosus]OAU50580.1 Malolactic regulator [Lacticaseibacillus rhamnosus]OAU54296.1 Malolactic regulator [Lacticaseibacillus rhamnosus]
MAILPKIAVIEKPAQKSTCQSFGCDGQSPIITFKTTCVLVYAHNALTGAEVCV